MAIAGEFGLDLTPEGRAALSMLDELEDIVVEVGYQADQMAIDGETSLAEIAYFASCYKRAMAIFRKPAAV